MNAALRAARPRDPRWAALDALARAMARAVDDAGAAGEVRATVQAADQLLAVLRELRLTPGAAGEGADDGLGSLLADLSRPEIPAPPVGD